MSDPRANKPMGESSATFSGTPGVWMMAGALILSLVMIVGLAAIIVGQGLTAFWPKPIERLTLSSGEVVLGQPVRSETFEPTRTERRASAARGEPLPEGTLTRILYRVGNRDLGNQPFRWVNAHEIEEQVRPAEAVFVERSAWGPWIGTLAGLEVEGASVTGDEAGQRLDAQLALASERRHAMNRIRKGEMGAVSRELEDVRLAQASLRFDAEPVSSGMPMGLWIGGLGVAAAGMFGAWRFRSLWGGSLARAVGIAVVALCTLLWVEHPRSEPASGDRETMTQSLEARESGASARFAELQAELARLESEDEGFRIVLVDSQGRTAPRSRSEPDEAMLVSQVVRVVQANQMGFGDKLGVYFSRWREFVTGDPREANTEGGVFPVIIGTTLLTTLLTVVVVPLGVMAALYMREYAKQGLVISILRIAINNLAGVPSIVYGVFGLGFFCYTVGRYIDRGPTDPAPVNTWWSVGVVVVLMALSGVALAALAKSLGPIKTTRHRLLAWIGGAVWVGAGVGVLWLIGSTPYFGGFFEAKSLDGTPTFGGRGLLWASLTLALLTLPVVIVATEEAIAAVPQSLREGSFGCGASHWQTIRRVVLPGAMPGVMTGAILAMARGAGEVAPLMVVGAVKLAPDLPFEARFPFVFADRSFMHLGFHIYDLGFQSPDSEASRGLVWATTLLLLVLVFLLNLTAIIARSRMRRRLLGGQF